MATIPVKYISVKDLTSKELAIYIRWCLRRLANSR